MTSLTLFTPAGVLLKAAPLRLAAKRLTAMGFAVTMNNVKIASSETILEIVNHVMLICGIMGYKNGTPFSVGRHLRDAHSAQLMISNDRILGNTSSMLLVHKQDTSLLG